MTRFSPLFIVLLLFASCRPAHAGELTSETIKQDPRLAHSVSVVAKRIYIGELMEQLAAQSGVPIKAGEADGAADVEVTVSLHHIPVSQAMDALWSLVSYQGAKWEWVREGDAADYRYTLAQPDSARALPLTIQKQIQAQFENQANKLKAALTMTPEQLEEAAKGDPLLDSFAKNEDPRVRPGMTIFSDLPLDVQSAILQQHQGVTIPVSELPASGQAFVHQQWLQTRDSGGMTKDEKGNLIPVREPKFICVSGYHALGDLAPWLTVDTGFGSGGYVGGGWMEEDWQKKIDALWILDSDSTDDKGNLKLAPALVSKHAPDANYPLADNLLRLSKAASVPLIARLPDEKLTGGGRFESNFTSLQACLDRLVDYKVAHKWHGPVLLLCDSTWLTQEEPVPTDSVWHLVRRLRDSEAKNGFLTFDDLTAAACALNASQLRSLSSSFPVMATAAIWHDFLAEVGGSPSIKAEYFSPSGSDWIKAVKAAATVFGPEDQRQVQDGQITHVVVLQEQDDTQRPPVRKIMIHLLTDQKVMKDDALLSYTAHQWHPAVMVDDESVPRPQASR